MKHTRWSVLLSIGAALCLALLSGFSAAASPAEPRTSGVAVQPQILTPQMYLPVLHYNWFPAYEHSDGFDNVNSGWGWGTGEFDYGYKTDSDGAKVYHIRTDGQEDVVFVSGPPTVQGTYAYKAIMRRATSTQPRQWGDEYGLLLSPTVIDPKARVGSNIYTFAIELRIGSGTDTYYSISKWSDINAKSRTILKRAAEGVYLTATNKIWNQLKIERSGDTLHFFVSRQEGTGFLAWQEVFSYTDTTLPDSMYVGFYHKHATGTYEDYVIEFQFDTLYIRAEP